MTCTNHSLEVDQSTLCQYKVILHRNPRTCPFSARFRRRPCERDGPIGRVLWSCCDSIPRRVLNATKRSVATLLSDLTAPSPSSHPSVMFCSRPVAILTKIRRDLTFGTPKYHGCLNTLHQSLGDEFTSYWGRVEEFLVAGEQKIVHTKPFFFPFSSAATCTNCSLEVDQ
ncbi:hypothetical protein Taro_027909, partial [Colocasia esculenta]|nr:hypothetical protein [Colocasia esculenta]